jgi:hypothetical protein
LKVAMDKVKPFVSVRYGDLSVVLVHEIAIWRRVSTGLNGKLVIYKVSVCERGCLLGSAGFLKNKTATISADHKTLENYCDDVVKYRIVDDNNMSPPGRWLLTDLGLYLCEKLLGANRRN